MSAASTPAGRAIAEADRTLGEAGLPATDANRVAVLASWYARACRAISGGYGRSRGAVEPGMRDGSAVRTP